jgi:alanine racemase
MNKVKYYASYLDINLDAIQHNCRICADKFRVPIMAVVKADAYGFGALPVAKACAEAGVESFAVARIQEGIELREGAFGRIFWYFLSKMKMKCRPLSVTG